MAGTFDFSYWIGGELKVFSGSGSEKWPAYTRLSVLKSVAQIFNIMGWGVGGGAEAMQEGSPKGNKWNIYRLDAFFLPLGLPMQVNSSAFKVLWQRADEFSLILRFPSIWPQTNPTLTQHLFITFGKYILEHGTEKGLVWSCLAHMGSELMILIPVIMFSNKLIVTWAC